MEKRYCHIKVLGYFLADEIITYTAINRHVGSDMLSLVLLYPINKLYLKLIALAKGILMILSNFHYTFLCSRNLAIKDNTRTQQLLPSWDSRTSQKHRGKSSACEHGVNVFRSCRNLKMAAINKQ